MLKTLEITKFPLFSYLERWLTYCRAEGLSEVTITDYHTKASKFVWWFYLHSPYGETNGDHPNQITSDHAREFVTYLRQIHSDRWGLIVPPGREKLSPASVASFGRTVKVFFGWMVERRFIEHNPFNQSVKLTSKHKKNTIIKTVPPENLQILLLYLMQPERLAAFEGVRDLALISLLIDSGIRRGELLSLTIGDVDLIRYRCTVRGKTGQRIAVFSLPCKQAIEHYLKHPILTDLKPTSPLWLTSTGEPINSIYTFNSIIRRIRAKSGVNFYAHKLRHTFASTLAGAGVSPWQLQSLMGHSSVTTTMIYVHQNPEILQASYQLLSPLSRLVSQEDSPEEIKKRKRGRPPKGR